MLGEEATEAYEGARATVARFLGAPEPETIVFTRGVTESMNLVAQGWGRTYLREGDEILITEMEHHSNIVPWQMTAAVTGATLRYIPLTDDGLLDLSQLGSLLTERTKILSVTGMSNALGTITPLRQLADAAHAVGAVIAVDAAQLAPHSPIDVQALDVDLLGFTGHKMLGPTASGGLYGKAERARGDGADARRRRDDPRGLPRPQHLQAGAVQVRGRHDADRPAGRPRRRDRLPRSARHGRTCAPTRRRSPATRSIACSTRARRCSARRTRASAAAP